MHPVSFDPFGESLALDHEHKASADASRLALNTGVGLFWVMVFVIVAARVAYFEPNLSAKLGGVAAMVNHFKTIVGV